MSKEELRDKVEALTVTILKNEKYDLEEILVNQSKVLELIDQLDEIEVLSWEWIDENKKDSGVHYIGYYVPIGRLHDLLVPKQEEMKVSKTWHDIIAQNKEEGHSLRWTLNYIDNLNVNDVDDFAKAWLAYPNIEVEEEQKYILSINITDKASKTNYETFLNKRGIFHSMDNESFNNEEFNWTEKEIKDLESGDILFEHFAVKVKELEE